MAKAIAEVNKAAGKSGSARKRPSSSSATASSSSTPKRSTFKSKPVVCYSCQRTGHIAPNCPSLKDRPSTSSSSCLLYTSPSPRDRQRSRMPSSA